MHNSTASYDLLMIVTDALGALTLQYLWLARVYQKVLKISGKLDPF